MTISGPPTTLKQLFQQSSSLTASHAAIPVYGPYHASHLHRGVDIDQILYSKDSKTSNLFSAYSLDLPLMSTSSGACFDKSLDAPTLFAAVIRDILTETLNIRQTVDGCTRLAKEANCGECSIISFGPSSSKSMFAKAMESETGFRVTLHEDLAAKLLEAPSAFGDSSRTSKKPKLAIVGMAGRFPNAADHEKFWELLEAGLDVHKRVCISINFQLWILIILFSQGTQRSIQRGFTLRPDREGSKHQPYPFWLLHRRAWSLRSTILQHVSS